MAKAATRPSGVMCISIDIQHHNRQTSYGSSHFQLLDPSPPAARQLQPHGRRSSPWAVKRRELSRRFPGPSPSCRFASCSFSRAARALVEARFGHRVAAEVFERILLEAVEAAA